MEMGLLSGEILGVMPRENRNYIPGHAWHITHRCHKKEFLLKFAKDRQNWIDWLYEAMKRYKMVVLNYMATSNCEAGFNTKQLLEIIFLKKILFAVHVSY